MSAMFLLKPHLKEKSIVKATAKKIKNPQDDKHLISPHWTDENYFQGNPLNVHNTVPPAFRILTVCLIKIKANFFILTL